MTTTTPFAKPPFSGLLSAFALAVSLAAGTVWSASKGDSFQQALRMALENNPNMASAAANLRAAQERLGQARAALMPNISLEAGQNHIRSDYRNLFTQKSDPRHMGVVLSQSLFNWQAVEAYRQTTPFIEAYAQDFESVRQNLTLQVLQNAIEWLQSREVLGLAENNLRLTEHHLEATRARFTVGELTQTDVSQARARASLAQANRISADNAMAVAAAKYVEMVGLTPAEDLSLPVLQSKFLKVDQAQINELLTQRPDMEAARLRVEVSDLNVDMENAGHLPVVKFSSSLVQRAGQEAYGAAQDVTEYNMGVTLSVPVFSGGMTTSRTDQARAERDGQVANLDRLRLQAQREIAQSLLDIHSAEASVKALEDGVSATRAAMDGVEQEFQVGTRTSLDLLDAQNEYFTAQTNLAKSRYSWELARYRLLRAVGRLTLPELGMVEATQ